MKKIIFILFAMFLFVSCETYVKQDDANHIEIPYEVSQKLLTDTVTVNLYVYKTTDYHYFFNEKKELVSRYYVDGYVNNIGLTLFLLFVIILLIIGIINN